jgi:hypothetical protein
MCANAIAIVGEVMVTLNAAEGFTRLWLSIPIQFPLWTVSRFLTQ